MAIQRWDPRRDLMELQERMKRLFDDALSRSAGADREAAGAGWRPPLDLFEEPERFVLRADVPGVAAADVDVQVEEGNLVLRGERKVDAGMARDSFLRIERPHGPFSAQIALPSSVDAENIRASHRNGVIEVVLPKRRESVPSRIEVSAD